jgi:TRAP-type mannitol/chloroaromatic compound transport system permease large subunit
VIAVVVAAFLVFVAISMPMGGAIGLAVALALAVASPYPLAIMFQKMLAGTDNFVLVAIPLFILAGNLMNAGGITDRIFTFVRRCTGSSQAGSPTQTWAQASSSPVCRARRWPTRPRSAR